MPAVTKPQIGAEVFLVCPMGHEWETWVRAEGYATERCARCGARYKAEVGTWEANGIEVQPDFEAVLAALEVIEAETRLLRYCIADHVEPNPLARVNPLLVLHDHACHLSQCGARLASRVALYMQRLDCGCDPRPRPLPLTLLELDAEVAADDEPIDANPKPEGGEGLLAGSVSAPAADNG